MKDKQCNLISDILVLFVMRMKLILKDITMAVVLVVSVIAFALIIQSMSSSAQDLSSVPIGIVDYDDSSSSMELIRKLEKVEMLRLIQKDEDELKKLMLDETVYSVFVIEKGYEEKLKSGDLQGAVTIYYKKKNASASILSDVVAGEMIYLVSLYKSYRYYDKISGTDHKLSQKEYQDYMKNLIGNDDEFNFAFRFHYANQNKALKNNQKLSASVLYNQCIFGILGILMAFIAMFLLSQTVKEKETGVDIRLKISKFHILKRDAANLCALLILESMISLIFIGLIFHQLQINNIELWLSAFLLLLFNTLVLGAVMQLLAKALNRMLLYQVVCSLLILLTGGMGFYRMVNSFFHGISDNMIKIIPNSWFIMGFTDIIVYGSSGGFLKEGHKILLIMAAVLFLLIIGIDLIMEYDQKMRKTRS